MKCYKIKYGARTWHMHTDTPDQNLQNFFWNYDEKFEHIVTGQELQALGILISLWNQHMIL